MPLIVFQHSDSARPGRLGATLRDHGLLLTILRPDRGDEIPPDLDGVDGVISLGGPQSCAAGAERPVWMDLEMEFLRCAHDAELPVVGVCLGHQMLAMALGGEVQRMPKPEIGFCDIEISPAGQTDAILSGIPWRSPQFSHHEDEVKKAPPGATALASSKACAVQSFRAGIRSYGFQFHFEADRPMVDVFTRSSPEQLAAAGLAESKIAEQADTQYERFARVANRLCLNLATYLLPTGRRVTESSVRL